MAIEVTQDTFEKEVLSTDRLVLVDFWGPQCAPCLALMPQVERLAGKYESRIKLTKIDASKNRRFCLNLKVLGLPTFLFYVNREEVAHLSGANLTIGDLETAVKGMIQ